MTLLAILYVVLFITSLGLFVETHYIEHKESAFVGILFVVMMIEGFVMAGAVIAGG